MFLSKNYNFAINTIVFTIYVLKMDWGFIYPACYLYKKLYFSWDVSSQDCNANMQNMPGQTKSQSCGSLGKFLSEA